jgi:hypothetical protein
VYLGFRICYHGDLLWTMYSKREYSTEEVEEAFNKLLEPEPPTQLGRVKR